MKEGKLLLSKKYKDGYFIPTPEFNSIIKTQQPDKARIKESGVVEIDGEKFEYNDVRLYFKQ